MDVLSYIDELSIENFETLDSNDLELVDGGVLTLTIFGVTFAGWKAAALIAAGVTTLSGAAAFGFYNGRK